jgi:hypothetical protein
MFELRSIGDLNQRLDCLAVSGRPGGFPTHINLQMRAPTTAASAPGPSTSSEGEVMSRQIQRLKDQNKMLTEEVGRTSNFITNLEQEKSALIRQLFQARSVAASASVIRHPNQQPPAQLRFPPPPQSQSHNDTTFM